MAENLISVRFSAIMLFLEVNMKKIFTIIFILIMSLGCFDVYASEYKICYHSDIVAYIDGVPIRSYNMEGKTWIVAEDLSKYKFRVDFSEKYKLLMIDYVDTDLKELTADYVPDLNYNDIGNVVGKAYKSTLSVRVGRKYVEAYDLAGKTIILFDELNNFGSVDWNSENREIRYTYKPLWEQEILSEKDIERGSNVRQISLEMKKENNEFIINGENLNYLDDIKIKSTRTEGMCFNFSIYQRVKTEAEEIISLFEKIINEDYEGNLINSDLEKANKYIKIRVNNESVYINKISQGKGNGHVDYYIYFGENMDKENIYNLEIKVSTEAVRISGWAENEIKEAVELGYVLEELQDDYQENITREEFAATAVMYLAYLYNMQIDDMMDMWCLTHVDEKGKSIEIKDSFIDLDGSEFGYYIMCADTLGIVKGRGEGIFDPFSNITREEAAVMLNNVFFSYATGFKLGYYDLSKMTDYEKISEWAKSSVRNMYVMNVMKGVSETEFSPQGQYTREQCFATFLRLNENGNIGRINNDALEFMSYQEMVEEIENRAYYESWYKEENENYIIMYGQQAPGGRMNATSFYIIYKNGGRKNLVTQFGFVDLKLSLSDFELDESGHFLYCIRHESEGGQRYKIDLQNALVEIIDN